VTGKVSARADEGIAVEDVEDAGDREQDVVLGDLNLTFETARTTLL